MSIDIVVFELKPNMEYEIHNLHPEGIDAKCTLRLLFTPPKGDPGDMGHFEWFATVAEKEEYTYLRSHPDTTATAVETAVKTLPEATSPSGNSTAGTLPVVAAITSSLTYDLDSEFDTVAEDPDATATTVDSAVETLPDTSAPTGGTTAATEPTGLANTVTDATASDGDEAELELRPGSPAPTDIITVTTVNNALLFPPTGERCRDNVTWGYRSNNDKDMRKQHNQGQISRWFRPYIKSSVSLVNTNAFVADGSCGYVLLGNVRQIVNAGLDGFSFACHKFAKCFGSDYMLLLLADIERGAASIATFPEQLLEKINGAKEFYVKGKKVLSVESWLSIRDLNDCLKALEVKWPIYLWERCEDNSGYSFDNINCSEDEYRLVYIIYSSFITFLIVACIV